MHWPRCSFFLFLLALAPGGPPLGDGPHEAVEPPRRTIFTLQMSPRSLAGNLVAPGTHVDLLQGSQCVLEDVVVRGVEFPPSGEKRVTLELRTEQQLQTLGQVLGSADLHLRIRPLEWVSVLVARQALAGGESLQSARAQLVTQTRAKHRVSTSVVPPAALAQLQDQVLKGPLPPGQPICWEDLEPRPRPSNPYDLAVPPGMKCFVIELVPEDMGVAPGDVVDIYVAVPPGHKAETRRLFDNVVVQTVWILPTHHEQSIVAVFFMTPAQTETLLQNIQLGTIRLWPHKLRVR